MKKLILLIILFTSFASGYSQVDEKLSPEEKARREKNIQAGNPFKKLGYYPKIATLSKGKYLEFHDLDSIVRIGSFTFNTNTMSVVNYVRLDTVHSEATLRPELISRWFSTDPLSDEYPSWSPYNFVMGNPIRFIDPDGRKVIVPQEQDQQTFSEYLSNIFGNGNFSYDKNGYLQFVGSRSSMNRLQKKALDFYLDAINKDYDISIKLSNFTDVERELIKEETGFVTEGGAMSRIYVDENGEVTKAEIFVDPNTIHDVPLFKVNQVYKNSDGEVIVSDTCPDNATCFKSYQMVNNGVVRTAPKSPEAIVTHEIGHAIYEGDDQRKVLRIENLIRRILNLTPRSDEDPEHHE